MILKNLREIWRSHIQARLQMANIWDRADRYVVIAMERIESTTTGSRLGPNAWLNLSSGTLCENLHFLGGYGVKRHPGCFSQANVLQLTVAILQATVALSFQDLRLACGIPLWLLWSREDWNMSHEFCQDKRLYYDIQWWNMFVFLILSFAPIFSFS